MIVFPNAKINLGLHIVEKRPDGFHNIETIFYPVKGLTDVVEATPDDRFSFARTGIEIDGRPEDDLCVRAYKLMAARYGIPPVNMSVHKLIPPGAGLGGGSSDAAFVIQMLNDMFSLKTEKENLKKLAAESGSDCAFFIENRPCFAAGRGELLAPISVDLSGYRLLIVKPDIYVSTGEAYSKAKPEKPDNDLRNLMKLPVGEWRNLLINDFEKSVFAIRPEIGEIKRKMYDSGAEYASMSGSGASVFGLFKGDIPDTKIFSENYFVYSGYV